MIKISTNLSQMIREIDYKGKAVFQDVGDALAEGIWEEFEILVRDTAQWTGTAAASWKLSLGGDSSGPIVMPKRTRQEALHMGHEVAVQKALAHNRGALDDLSSIRVGGKGKSAYRAIVVENPAESADRAESGPLRSPANDGAAGAFFRFQERVAFRSFEIIRDRSI